MDARALMLASSFAGLWACGAREAPAPDAGILADAAPTDAEGIDAGAPDAAAPDGGGTCGRPAAAGGSIVRAVAYGGSQPDEAAALAATPEGDVVMTGWFGDTLDLGGGPMTAPPLSMSMRKEDVLVARYSPAGEHRWSHHYGDAAAQRGNAVALDAAGNAVVVGQFYGRLDLGGGPLSNVDETDLFVAKLDRDGRPLWSRSWGNSLSNSARGVAVDRDGNVVVVGRLSGTIDFGDGPLTGTNDVFVLKLSPDGALVFARRFGDEAPQWAQAVAVDAAGDILITGAMAGAVDFGGGPLETTSADDFDLFVTKLGPDGAHLWSRRYGDATPLQAGRAIAVDGDGAVVVGGAISGAVDFGGGPIAGPSGGSADATDAFVLELSPEGAHRWSRAWGDEGDQVVTGVAAVGPGSAVPGSAGGVVVVGWFAGQMDPGGGPLRAGAGARSFLGEDLFAVRLTPDGAHAWSRSLGSGSAEATAVAVDDCGRVTVAGTFTGALSVGGETLRGAGLGDVVVLQLEL